MPHPSVFEAVSRLPWTMAVPGVLGLLAVLAGLVQRAGQPDRVPPDDLPAAWSRTIGFAIIALFAGLGIAAFGLHVIAGVSAVGIPIAVVRCELARAISIRWRCSEAGESLVTGGLAALDAWLWCTGMCVALRMGMLGLSANLRDAMVLLVPLAAGPAIHSVLVGRPGRARIDAAIYACTLAAIALGAAAAYTVPGLTILHPSDPQTGREINQPLDLALALVTAAMIVGSCIPMLPLLGSAWRIRLLLVPAMVIAAMQTPLWVAGFERSWAAPLSAGAAVAAAMGGAAVLSTARPVLFNSLLLAAMMAGYFIVGFERSADMALLGVAWAAMGALTCWGANTKAAVREPLPAACANSMGGMVLTLSLGAVVLVGLTADAGVFARDQRDFRRVYARAGLTEQTVVQVEAAHAMLAPGHRFAILLPNAMLEGDSYYIDGALVADTSQNGLDRLATMPIGRLFTIETETSPDKFEPGGTIQEARRMRLTTVPSTHAPGESPLSVVVVAARHASVADAAGALGTVHWSRDAFGGVIAGVGITLIGLLIGASALRVILSLFIGLTAAAVLGPAAVLWMLTIACVGGAWRAQAAGGRRQDLCEDLLLLPAALALLCPLLLALQRSGI